MIRRSSRLRMWGWWRLVCGGAWFFGFGDFGGDFFLGWVAGGGRHNAGVRKRRRGEVDVDWGRCAIYLLFVVHN
jgi:hypothetical protein